MIAIGCATTDERAFRAAGGPTVEALDEGNSLLLRRHGHESIDEPYNDMLAVAADRSDLEAMVLVHQDAVVTHDARAPQRIRALLAANPDVAVVGSVAIGPTREATAAAATLLALSPWAARELRFDPALGGSAEAVAADLSLRARAAGRRVLVAPLGVVRGGHGRVERRARRAELRALTALRMRWDDATLAVNGRDHVGGPPSS